MRSLPLVNRLHLAPRALLRRKALEVKDSLVSERVDCDALRHVACGIGKLANSYIGAGPLRGLAPSLFRRYAAIEVIARRCGDAIHPLSSPAFPRRRHTRPFDPILHIE